MRIKRNIFFFLLVLVFILSLFTVWYALLCIGLFFILVVLMLDKLGKGIVLREIVALHSCFICLLMPLAGYAFFDKANHLAKTWVRYMPIPQEVYFGFALPAIAGFAMALFWPSKNPTNNDSGVFLQDSIVRARAILQHKPWTGIHMLLIGTIMFWVSDYVPGVLQFVSLLFFFASFAGFLYVYYAKSFRFRTITLLFFSIFILMTALSSGMFTIVAYMGLTLFSFFFLGRRTPFWKKLMWFLAGVFMLLLIQSVKPEYRRMTWVRGGYTGNQALLFGNLLSDKLFNFDWQSTDAFFPIYYRANQGFNIAMVMRRFPSVKPYDDGANLLVTGVSALVPRFLWPDKPEAGGKFNMQYYAGIYITGWSTNVGPLGEAYGSFGVAGGISFMFFLGLFIRWSYRRVYSIARRIPLLIFWIPVLFYQVTYSAETDTLQILNSLIKAAFFIWLLYKLVPNWFTMEKKKMFRIPRWPAEEVTSG